jgi:hypothetical protein
MGVLQVCVLNPGTVNPTWTVPHVSKANIFGDSIQTSSRALFKEQKMPAGVIPSLKGSKGPSPETPA